MDILVISENKLPHFVEEFFKPHKVYFFTARGSIQCQSILNTKKIQRIFFFYTRATQKIEEDIIQVINKKEIPVVLFFETQKEDLSLQKSNITQYYYDIFLDTPQHKILDQILFFLQPITNRVTAIRNKKKQIPFSKKSNSKKIKILPFSQYSIGYAEENRVFDPKFSKIIIIILCKKRQIFFLLYLFFLKDENCKISLSSSIFWVALKKKKIR